ncbi:hypothetical protein KFE25_002867 [Diacronema lutheri]|mgnify:CR=1 FL=1|uniref:Uncharacterized protein n=1 Tax=Diacronema lutheri TaxID=2081491 RepID=A0A8J6CD78_DIALT|nr:hypothetical protein KFE25_002867 [Diacronema lutheri]
MASQHGGSGPFVALRADVLVGLLRGSDAARQELALLLTRRDARALSERHGIDLLPTTSGAADDGAKDEARRLDVDAERAALALRAGMLEYWKAELGGAEPDVSPPGSAPASPNARGATAAARSRISSRSPSSSSSAQAMAAVTPPAPLLRKSGEPVSVVEDELKSQVRCHR